ncbi:GFA family protein [Methylomonas fluvii]|uniref:GFA family protein n=1 Tax=Methylomonas fluvii TaxID=1854564 RepID=A0ABR9DI00_9GAMM|nr:GFA family protein [Methylomonas fluvii]MBD9362545.1 GFA family protein [Methylomonas fluvii]CAD6875656.1 hypothetical protein [Methylomonas fluvii]
MSKFKGGCMCGAVQYAVKSEPRLSFLCQCRQCQRITGTGHSAEFVGSAKDTMISGALKFYELTADSGNTVTSGFCPTCGDTVRSQIAHNHGAFLGLGSSLPETLRDSVFSLGLTGMLMTLLFLTLKQSEPWKHRMPPLCHQ